MIKSVLVPMDASEYAQAALQSALALARPYEARLTGLYVLDIRFLEMPPYLDYSYTFEAVPPTILPLDVLEQYRLKSERILASFSETVAKAGLSGETRTEEGVPSQVIAEVGKTHDLIVMGKRGEHAKWGRDLLGSTAESVVRRSGTPVFLTESSFREIKEMMVMFDGSIPGVRALKLAAELALQLPAAITVFTADDDAERGRSIQAEAASYLAAAGLQATYVVEPGRPAKAAAGRLEENPADLVVLGTQGHSVLYHVILGSTAEQIMRTVALPILLVP